MPLGTRHYRLRIRTATDEADLLSVTSVSTGLNPYIESVPRGDGQTLDPLTGKVSVGAYNVRVIDAPGLLYVTSGAPITDGLEYASQAAMEAADWVITDSLGNGTITVGATDQVHGGSRSLKFATTGNGIAAGGMLDATKTYTASDGIIANELYTVTVYGRMSARSPWDVNSWLIVNGVSTSINTSATWELLSVTVRASENATLAVTLRRKQAFINQTRDIWFDDLEIQGLIASTTVQGRVITSALADAEARQQLLSKRAYVEESEDGGSTWDVLTLGYVNRVALVDGLLYEITVGESRRVEQSKKVFDRISDPAEHPEFIGVLDRASCLMGGPIVGDWGGVYRDRGRPMFEVSEILESDANGGTLNMRWVDGGGSLHAVYKEDGPPMAEHVAVFINDSAREYVDVDLVVSTITAGPLTLSFALAPGLICRVYDADTGAWVQDATCVLRRLSGGFGFGAGDWGLTSEAGKFAIQWTGTVPSEGARYRFAVFPRTTSERNPIHWDGHPVDLVKNVLDLIDTSYNDASLESIRSYLGEDLVTHLRITQGETAQKFLEDTVYGPFGFAPRLNDSGELEFVATRDPEAPSIGGVTLDDLAGEAGTLWQNEESTAANRVIVETQAFLLDTRRPDTGTPFDAIRMARITTNVKAEGTDEQQVFGDKEVRFTIPGSLQIGDAILAAGTQDDPGSLDRWVGALARPLFDWQGRGAIRADLDVRRGVTDARIGDVLSLDLAYFPSANPADSPVSQRGADLRKAVVLRRTVKPDRISLHVEDRGIDASLGCLPTFSLAADADFPKTTVTVTVTNEASLSYPVRVEMAQGALEPAGGGQFVRFWIPQRDANPFDLPPVCAGNSVWVRMRCEENGQIGSWTSWQNLDLADLTAPSGLTAVVVNTTVQLSWTNGETTYAIEVLYRATADTTFQSATILPAGSTTYTLNLLDASTSYTFGVRYIDPKGCSSATTTVATSTDVVLQLPPPINPAAWANGQGTFGMECDATVIPGGVNVWVAPETAVGSGTPDTFEDSGEVQAVAGGRTRFQYPFVVPNDGRLWYLKARSTSPGYTPSEFCDIVSINPWTVVEPPDDPTEQPVPGAETGIVEAWIPIPLLRQEWGILTPGAARTVITTWRGTEEHPVLENVKAVYLAAGVVASSLPSGAFLAVEAEFPGTLGSWIPFESTATGATEGPYVLLDSTSLDTLDANTGETAWNVKGDTIAVDDTIQGSERVRLVIGGGDDTGAIVLSWATLWVLVGADVQIDPVTPNPSSEDPGSCTTPGDFDDFSYADQATAFAAWPQD